jgi:hypothetical protein
MSSLLLESDRLTRLFPLESTPFVRARARFADMTGAVFADAKAANERVERYRQG